MMYGLLIFDFSTMSYEQFHQIPSSNSWSLENFSNGAFFMNFLWVYLRVANQFWPVVYMCKILATLSLLLYVNHSLNRNLSGEKSYEPLQLYANYDHE